MKYIKKCPGLILIIRAGSQLFLKRIPNIILYEQKVSFIGNGMSFEEIVYFNNIEEIIEPVVKHIFRGRLNDKELEVLANIIKTTVVGFIKDKLYFLEPIRNPSVSSKPTESYKMDSSATDLITLIYTYKSKELPEFKEFVTNVKKIMPEISSILVPPNQEVVTIGIKEEGFSDLNYFELSQLSSGLIEALSIVAIITLCPKGSIICIEEPELHFHSHALKELKKIIIDVSKEKQLFFTTHSLAFIGNEEINKIFLFTKEKGLTKIKRLQTESEIDEVVKEME